MRWNEMGQDDGRHSHKKLRRWEGAWEGRSGNHVMISYRYEVAAWHFTLAGREFGALCLFLR